MHKIDMNAWTVSIYGGIKNAVVLLLQNNLLDYNNNNLHNISSEEQILLILWILIEHWEAISSIEGKGDSYFFVLFCDIIFYIKYKN